MNVFVSLLTFVAACSVAMGNNSSCSDKSVPDCTRVDHGSCGNACCGIDVDLAVDAGEAFTGIMLWLARGGEDKAFAYSNASDAAGHNPGQDLRPYHVPGGYAFIFQGFHTTTGGYVDTLNFNIKTTATGCTVRAFSISDIHGALGDAGQNFKTLAYMMSYLQPDGYTFNVFHGCGGDGVAVKTSRSLTTHWAIRGASARV